MIYVRCFRQKCRFRNNRLLLLARLLFGGVAELIEVKNTMNKIKNKNHKNNINNTSVVNRNLICRFLAFNDAGATRLSVNTQQATRKQTNNR